MKKANTIYEMYARLRGERPTALAVVDEHGSLTHLALEQWADAIVREFPSAAPRHIGIVMNHSRLMIAAMLATVKAGGAYVPAEPTFPPERIRYMMAEAKVDFILTDLDRPGEWSSDFRIVDIRHICERPPQADTPLAPAGPQSGRNPAYILYTSGTTGKPKGVVVENRNVCHYVRAFNNEFHLTPDDVMLQHSVCSFDIFTEEVWASLLNGAALAVPSARTKETMPQLMRFIERHRVTMLSGFPYLLLDMNKLTRLPQSLRLLISGGDVLRHSYIDNILVSRPDLMIYNTYGPSETTVCATYQRCDNIPPLADGTYPIGSPVLGATIEVLAPDGRPTAVGETGEICIGGGGVSRGYLRRCPESANFVRRADGERVYYSGDLGYIDADGRLCFLRRKDSQVMIMGKRVECDEVQNVLANCDEVESGVVRPLTDERGLSYLVAYVVPDRLKKFSIEGLKRRLARYLTSFMIPEIFVTLKRMPLTPNGKPDLAALPIPTRD